MNEKIILASKLIDKHGRVALPLNFRKKITAGRAIVYEHLDYPGAFVLYAPPPDCTEILGIPIEVLQTCAIDEKGRFMIPKNLRSRCGIMHEVTFHYFATDKLLVYPRHSNS